jgi:hypothetical protein
MRSIWSRIFPWLRRSGARSPAAGTGARPRRWGPYQPNATVRDLRGYHLNDVARPGDRKPTWLAEMSEKKMANVRAMRDDQLIESINNPSKGWESVVSASRSRMTVDQGNHRIYELQQRVAAGRIPADTPIFINWTG